MAAKTRKLRFDGEMDTVDMRPVLGYRPGTPEYEGKDAQRFVFHRRGSKTNPQEGNRQYREGVEMTEEQALEILTSPYRAWGFVDITDMDVPELLPVTLEGLSAIPLVPPAQGGVGDYELAPMAVTGTDPEKQAAKDAEDEGGGGTARKRGAGAAAP